MWQSIGNVMELWLMTCSCLKWRMLMWTNFGFSKTAALYLSLWALSFHCGSVTWPTGSCDLRKLDYVLSKPLVYTVKPEMIFNPIPSNRSEQFAGLNERAKFLQSVERLCMLLWGRVVDRPITFCMFRNVDPKLESYKIQRKARKKEEPKFSWIL